MCVCMLNADGYLAMGVLPDCIAGLESFGGCVNAPLPFWVVKSKE